jgi:hypothetical protein
MGLYFTMGPICQRPTLYPTSPPPRSPLFLSVLHSPPMETQCHWPAAGSPPRRTTGRPRSPPLAPSSQRHPVSVPCWPPLASPSHLGARVRARALAAARVPGRGGPRRGTTSTTRTVACSVACPRGVGTASSYRRARRSPPGATHRHGCDIPRLGGQRAARGSRAQRRRHARSHRLQLAPHAAVLGGGQPLRALPRPPRRGRGAPPQERRAPCRQRRHHASPHAAQRHWQAGRHRSNRRRGPTAPLWPSVLVLSEGQPELREPHVLDAGEDGLTAVVECAAWRGRGGRPERMWPRTRVPNRITKNHVLYSGCVVDKAVESQCELM